MFFSFTHLYLFIPALPFKSVSFGESILLPDGFTVRFVSFRITKECGFNAEHRIEETSSSTREVKSARLSKRN